MNSRSLEDIAGDFGLSHEVIKNYLKFKGVEWKDFFSVDDVNKYKSELEIVKDENTTLKDSIEGILERLNRIENKKGE